MKELRFLQPNQIDAESLNDPVKCKAYFDWKYENFEEEYKIYREEKRELLNDFLLKTKTLQSLRKQWMRNVQNLTNYRKNSRTSILC